MSEEIPTEINFPDSMDLRAIKATSEPTMKAEFLEFQSQNQTYGQREKIKIPISNTANTWLHGNDSFLSGRFKLTGALHPGGSISIDGTAFSLFKNARLLQNNVPIVEQIECGRNWNALFDFQVGHNDRYSKQISHCVAENNFVLMNPTLFGTKIVNNKYVYFSICLPMSIVGSLSEKSFPLGSLNTGFVLELDVEDLTKMITTRAPNNTEFGMQSATTGLTLGKIEIDQIIYHAKVTNVGIYNSVLMSSLGTSFVIPGVEYIHDHRDVPSGTSSISANFSFPVKSAKSIMFWFTNSETATGTEKNNKLNNAITQRSMGGNMKEYQISVDGKNFPQQPIKTDSGSTITDNNFEGVNGSIPFANLLRCFNMNSSSSGGGVLTQVLYSSAENDWDSDSSRTKRTILGIDLDRGSNDNDKYFQGMNLMNSTTSIRCVWNTAATEPHTLYAYVMHDVSFLIQNGYVVVIR